MKRADKENFEYKVETTYGYDNMSALQVDIYCPWFEAFARFDAACTNEDVTHCSVYYLDSKGYKREVLTYTAPCDY